MADFSTFQSCRLKFLYVHIGSSTAEEYYLIQNHYPGPESAGNLPFAELLEPGIGFATYGKLRPIFAISENQKDGQKTTQSIGGILTVS